jgi:hypothetical protein
MGSPVFVSENVDMSSVFPPGFVTTGNPTIPLKCSQYPKLGCTGPASTGIIDRNLEITNIG